MLKDDYLIDYHFLTTKINYPKRKKKTDTLKELNNLSWTISSIFRNKPSRKEKPLYISAKRQYNKTQSCTAKMFYGNTTEKHMWFLKSYMTQEAKKDVAEKPQLFNEEYDEMPVENILDYKDRAVPLHFRWIISPESQSVPLKVLVRTFVKNIEKATGFSLTWVAAEHHNTDNAHAHVLINGVDKKTGKPIHFSRELVCNTARKMAGNICTNLIGPQTEKQISRRKTRLPYSRRYTSLDAEIETYTTPFVEIKQEDNNEYEAQIVSRNEEMTKRLEFLVELGFAKKKLSSKPPIYYLEKKWNEKLKSIGRYNTFLNAHQEMYYVSGANLEILTKDTESAEGIVTKIYRINDEDSWRNAIVIENKKTNRAFYVPLQFEPKDELNGHRIKVVNTKNEKGKAMAKIIDYDFSNPLSKF